MNAMLMPDVRPRNTGDGHALLSLASNGVQRHVWESRYGSILIEVSGIEIFVNGQRVESHAVAGSALHE